MLPDFIADECVDQRIVNTLRQNGIKITSISEVNPGISDFEIINKYMKDGSVLISEDSDFGEWVFVHKMRNFGVMYLRYQPNDIVKITDSLCRVIFKYNEELRQKFIVITPQKIRVREI